MKTTRPSPRRRTRTPPHMSGRLVRGRRSCCLAVALVSILSSVNAEAASAERPVDALTSCWRQTALAGAANGCDPADAVVDATYRACLRQEATWHDALTRAGGFYGIDMANAMFSRVKTSTRTVLLRLVTTARAEKHLCR